MKISALIAASTITFASAAKLSLRYSSTEQVSATQRDAQIVVHGLAKDLTQGDAKTLGVSIVLAYNEAYASSGQSLEGSFNMKSASTVPEMSHKTAPAVHG
jgi:hypothetical protein